MCVCDPPVPACPSPVPVAPTLCSAWLCWALTPAVLVPLGVVFLTVPPSCSKTFIPPCYYYIQFIVSIFFCNHSIFNNFTKLMENTWQNISWIQHIFQLFLSNCMESFSLASHANWLWCALFFYQGFDYIEIYLLCQMRYLFFNFSSFFSITSLGWCGLGLCCAGSYVLLALQAREEVLQRYFK